MRIGTIEAGHISVITLENKHYICQGCDTLLLAKKIGFAEGMERTTIHKERKQTCCKKKNEDTFRNKKKVPPVFSFSQQISIFHRFFHSTIPLQHPDIFLNPFQQPLSIPFCIPLHMLAILAAGTDNVKQ
jgi:hypothetical protein